MARERPRHCESIQNGTLDLVSSPGLLSADRTQPPRCSQNILPAHKDRRSSCRLLHDVQEGGGRVRYRLRQEIRRRSQYNLDIRTLLVVLSRQTPHLLLQAGLFSAVSSAFVIDVHSNLQPDPNEQSAALLRAILLTLNQSAIPGESPTIPPIQAGPASETITTTCLMYASLLISLLAAFIAMLGKQWLNRYLRNSGGSMIERCGDRQRKCDGLKRWPLHFFIESLPVMLQAALLLLTCGLCRHMWSINATVAYTLICLTGLGLAFFIGIVIAGMSSYACPFQTPASTALRGPWKKIRHRAISSGDHFKRALSRMIWILKRRIWPLLRRPLLPIAISVRDSQVQESEPWLSPKDLAIICRTNADDVQCVSWILRNVTDPEALEAAVRLAGTIRWFDDGINADPPYDLIVSMFEGCFDPVGKLYTGSRDRAYYSGRAMMWINSLAMCKSLELASRFPLSGTKYEGPGLDPDLRHLLSLNRDGWLEEWRVMQLLATDPEHTPSHTQWSSDVLLRRSWAMAIRSHLSHEDVLRWIPGAQKTKTATPLNTTLNQLLSWCNFLGSPPAEEVLKVQNKSYGTSCFFLQITHSTLRQRIPSAHPKSIVQSRPFGGQW